MQKLFHNIHTSNILNLILVLFLCLLAVGPFIFIGIKTYYAKLGKKFSTAVVSTVIVFLVWQIGIPVLLLAIYSGFAWLWKAANLTQAEIKVMVFTIIFLMVFFWYCIYRLLLALLIVLVALMLLLKPIKKLTEVMMAYRNSK